MYSLATTKGKKVIISIRDDTENFRRLISLGLAPGREVRILINNGVTVVEFDNSILVLDRELALKVIVGDNYEAKSSFSGTS